MSYLLDGIRAVTPQQCVMYVVGALLIYLAIKKDYEPSLLLPMGFGAILVNLPMSGVLNQMVAGVGESQGIIQWLFETTIEASEALPLLLFIGIGAMIDFGPLLEKPWLMLFGAAAQFGIFITLVLAGLFFDLPDAASIAVIGAADGPTAIFVANTLGSKYLGAIMVAAYYGFVALVLALAFYLDTRRAFAFKNKPSEICLANEKHRWAVYYALVVALLVGYIMQSGGFGNSGFGMYAGF